MATKEQVIQDLDRVISLIKTDRKDLSAETKKQMVMETLDYFDNYVSPGWLKYRKSVSSDSEAGAVLEWDDEGAYIYGLGGEKFIDCLGGFGIYTCGHRNPEIMEVVRVAKERNVPIRVGVNSSKKKKDLTFICSYVSNNIQIETKE